MPSTYSNLKIQLMATGENTTTWGDVTNINLGTALEEAIAGTSDPISFSSANVTLTLTNTNGPQAARNVRLDLTGTATAGYNLVVPAIEKPYIINNGTDGTITVKNTTGTGIAVPAGKTMWVFNNGTNVVDVVTHLTSLTLASALPVLSGGTGSNTASGARTNLGLGTIATQNSNAVTITGGSITGITDLAVADGGTGASSAGDARTNLGLGTIATQNSNAVTITGGSITGITDLAVADGGTGASTAGDARTNLGLGSLAVLSSINNSNWSGTVLSVANGGTNASDAATARSNLGVPATDGTGASGTWGINVTGNAGTVTNGVYTTGTQTIGGTKTFSSTILLADGGFMFASDGAQDTGISWASDGVMNVRSNNVTVGQFNNLGFTGNAANVYGTVAIANGGTNATTAAGARTSLGSTTLGDNLFIIPNPSAVTFPRFNADNTVSALDAASFRTAIGAGAGGGSVTSVSFTGGIVSVATATTTPALTVAGTSGGIPYFSSATTWATSAALAANALVVGGGAGAAPATVTTGTGVITALGVAIGSAGAFVTFNGALGTPSSGTLTNCTFPTLNQNTTGSAGSVANAVTFTNTGGAAAGTTFNGSAARTIDYSTVGAPKADGTGASGTWGINVTGNAATATTATTASNATNLNSQAASYYTDIPARLGYTPVQQGGGTSQLTNKLYIGWGAGSQLRLQVDATDFASSWPISITGNAATATSATTATSAGSAGSATTAGTATNATNLVAANFSIVESGGVLYFKYGGTNIAKLESNGAFTALNNVTAYGSI